jgi:antitoxin (DNA-binding transcriptional repressor) of toxin-antitoxin stability system
MNVLEAKTNFSKIIAMLENHEEEEVIVARAGKPVVRISLIPQQSLADKLGMFANDPKKPIITEENWDPCAWTDEELKEIWGDYL